MFLARNRFFVSFAAFVGVAVLVIAAFLLLGQSTPAGSRYVISQRHRQFHPDILPLQVGDIITIVNDDGDLHHHAYVSSPDFNFDSGDQLPGSRTDVRFTVPGRFNVLCGIHPKMRLVVTVMNRAPRPDDRPRPAAPDSR